MIPTLVLVSVLSQQLGPKIIEVGQAVPVHTATKARAQKTAPSLAPEACAKAEPVVASAPAPAATNTNTAAPNGATPVVDEAKQAAAAKDYELQKQRMIKHAEASDELWRKSVDALAGQR